MGLGKAGGDQAGTYYKMEFRINLRYWGATKSPEVTFGQIGDFYGALHLLRLLAQILLSRSWLISGSLTGWPCSLFNGFLQKAPYIIDIFIIPPQPVTKQAQTWP